MNPVSGRLISKYNTTLIIMVVSLLSYSTVLTTPIVAPVISATGIMLNRLATTVFIPVIE